MNLSWLRLIISAMLVFVALSGATSSLAAPAAHDCASMSVMDDCPDHADKHSVPLRQCDSFMCGSLQLTLPNAEAPAKLIAIVQVQPIFNDTAHAGLSARPDIRPPISLG